MKSKYLQFKKREAAYHAVCDKAEERYISEVLELVKQECDQWGLEFSSWNGDYYFSLPFANEPLTKAINGVPKKLNYPGCNLIELLCPALVEILESAPYSNPRCCIGGQISNYVGIFSKHSLVCIQSNELEIDYQEKPDGSIVSLENAKEISYGPMTKNLAEAILNAEDAYRYFQLFDEFNVERVKAQFL